MPGFFRALLCLACLSSNVWAESRVFIYAGIPRSGRGDIASNLLMANLIRNTWPVGTEVVVIVPDSLQGYWSNQEKGAGGGATKSVHEVLPSMVASYRSEKMDQTINGVRYVTEKGGAHLLPARADLFLAFSMDGNRELPKVAERAAIRLSFEEYAPFGPHPEVKRHGGEAWGMALRVEEAGPAAFLMAGPRNAGLYVPPTAPPAPHEASRESLVQTLNGLKALDRPLEANHKLAFAYTDSFESTMAYLSALSQSGLGKPGEPVQVLIRKSFRNPPMEGAALDAAIKKLKLPAHVQVVRYDAIPMQTMNAVVALADVPPLVTGDGSLTSAYGRAFLYEALPHKQGAIGDLVERLRLQNPGFFTGERLERLKAALTSLNPKEGKSLYGWFGKGPNVKGMADFMADGELQKEVARASEAIRGDISLPAKLHDLVTRLEQFGPQPEFAKHALLQGLVRGLPAKSLDPKKLEVFLKELPLLPFFSSEALTSAFLNGHLNDEAKRKELFALLARFKPTMEVDPDLELAKLMIKEGFDPKAIHEALGRAVLTQKGPKKLLENLRAHVTEEGPQENPKAPTLPPKNQNVPPCKYVTEAAAA